MARVPVSMSVHPNVRWRTFDVNGRMELYRGLLVQFRYITHIAINRTAELIHLCSLPQKASPRWLFT
jgi:hypothetical protein